jgi:AcrR family transcriptional regulator
MRGCDEDAAEAGPHGQDAGAGSTVMTVIAPSTKEQIVLAAERLFAEHGIEGVSLRQIGAAAGNGNNSAVQYHFGTKERLVLAVFEFRLPRLRERRDLLLVERRPDDLRAWVECEARWMFEQSELEDSNYMSFVSMLTQYGREDVFDRLPDDLVTSTRAYHAHISSLLGQLPEPLRTHRIRRAMASLVHAAADRERTRASGTSQLPFAVALGDVVDGIVGYLEAPASAETLTALDRMPA